MGRELKVLSCALTTEAAVRFFFFVGAVVAGGAVSESEESPVEKAARGFLVVGLVLVVFLGPRESCILSVCGRGQAAVRFGETRRRCPGGGDGLARGAG